MSDRAELEALIRTQIEEPAGRRILEMVRAGHIGRADVDLFSTSAERYKTAVLAEYESFDPRVRDELRKSLLVDYQHEIDRLIKDIVARSAASAQKPKSVAGSEQSVPTPSGQVNAPEGEEGSGPAVSNLLGRMTKYLFPGKLRPPQ
ncbi:hypothetical protein ACQPYE_28315 [Actinosynnema sp. CA-299493]